MTELQMQLERLQAHASVPNNCEVQFLRVEENALRTLATAIYAEHQFSCWAPGEALEEKQKGADLILFRELLPGGRAVRSTFLSREGDMQVFEDTGYEYFQFLRELVSED